MQNSQKPENRHRGRIESAVLAMLCIGLVGCASYRPFVAPAPLPDDRNPIPEPGNRKYSMYADYIEKQTTEQIEQACDFAAQLRKLTGRQREAFNVDAFDEVQDSSWFTNRNARYPMTVEEVARGPDTGVGPDTTGTWTITRAKAEGVTPGFTIEDPGGDRYVIKFDPQDFPEMASGADIICTKLFYAAGYHVPEDYLTVFHPDILALDDEVDFTDAKGKERFMNESDLRDILDRIGKRPDGRIRALASKYLPGKPVGPFPFQGVRKDDPNDILDHEYRRELRGLYVMSEWLKNVDTKSGNTFDSYVTENGKSYIRHYLIDFGSTLGSGAFIPMAVRDGHENTLDPKALAGNILSLGLYVHDYEKKGPFPYPCIGTFQSEYFKPNTFKPLIPNPAFEAKTDRDGYWGAKQVMSFTDEMLEAVVREARYTDPRASEYMLRVLRERRDKIGRYWFGRVNPLDRFRLTRDGARHRLGFTDLAVETGLATSDGSRYRYDIAIRGERIVHEQGIGAPEILLPDPESLAYHLDRAGLPHAGHQWEITIRTWREDSGKWSRPTRVYLDFDPRREAFALTGIRR